MCLLAMKDEIMKVIQFGKNSLMNIPLDDDVQDG